MKDKGEIYLLVGKFCEYSAKTFQFIRASCDKSLLEDLRKDLERRVGEIQSKYQEFLSHPHSQDMYRQVIEDFELEARSISEKFNFRDDAEFYIETVDFYESKREGTKNGD